MVRGIIFHLSSLYPVSNYKASVPASLVRSFIAYRWMEGVDVVVALLARENILPGE